jgi:hypothetical protein
MAAKGIYIDEIVKEYKRYYIDNGQGVKDIAKKLFVPFGTENIMTVRRVTDSVYQGGTAQMTKILQAYQKSWTPLGKLTIKPNQIFLTHFKVDIDVDPYEVTDSWLEFLRDNKLSPKDFPLVKYMIEEFIIPQIQEELEMDAVFFGKKEELTPGQPLEAGKAIDGLRKQIRDKIVAGKIENIALPAITQSNTVQVIESFSDKVDKKLLRKNMTVNVSPTISTWYPRDKRNQYGYMGNDLSGAIDGSTLKVTPQDSMEGSKAIWTTPKNNVVSLWKADSNAKIFSIQEFKRELSIMTDFWWGCGFLFDPFVYAHIPDDELA